MYRQDGARVGVSAMGETYLSTLAYAALFYAAWTLLDVYRIDREYFWSRITFGALGRRSSLP
jgi:hypothetical protein